MLGARCAADEYRRRSRREPRCRELGRATACAELAPPLLQTTEAAAGAHCVVGLARTFPRVAASIADAVAPLGAADFFFVFGGAQASAAPDAAWRGAFDRFPQIAQFVVDDTGGQLQKLQLCFGPLRGEAAGRQYAWVAKHRPDLRWTAPLPAALARTRDVVHCYNLAGVCPRASRGATRYAAAAADGAGARALARLGDAYAAALRYATLGVDGQGPGSAAFGPWSSHDDKRPPLRAVRRASAARARAGARAAAPAPPTPPSSARGPSRRTSSRRLSTSAAPLMAAPPAARHLRAAVTWGGGVEWIEARAGRAV
ncbi:hypothetical protein JL720_11870 [Aureococcus anophagefferens]|nr:hypothetical protein JL720_11870 [Aureococcus anophagefferens]